MSTSKANAAPVALVTGGAVRVGRAIAIELSGAGCAVAVQYRRSADAACELVELLTRSGGRAVAISADLNQPDDWPSLIDQTVDRLGGLDILVNNASAFLTDGPDNIEAFDLKLWETMLRANLVAPAALCHHARTHLAASGRGKIINLGDIAADRPWGEHIAYCASKAGLVNLTRSLAKALAPDVQVNGIALGIAIFPDAYDEALRDRLVRQVPLQRAGTPNEVAQLVRFLVQQGHYITGQIIPIDGGRSIV